MHNAHMGIKTADIIIIGAGMVGLALAVLLAEAGFTVAVIDSKPPELTWNEDLPALRVSAINQASEQLLKTLSVWDGIDGQAYQQMKVWDANSSGHIEFNAREVAVPHLGYIVENRAIIRALWQKASRLDHVVLHVPATVKHFLHQAGDWQLTLSSGEIIKAHLLVGADGRDSQVRQQLGIPLINQFSGESAIVTAVSTEKPHRLTAYQRFLDNGPVAFLPLPHPQQCSIVWSTTPLEAERLLALEGDGFNQALAAAFDHHLGTVKSLVKPVAFPLQRHQAACYVKSQAVLVGDAAHSILPLAGQGVNLGFADAKALADILTNAKQRHRLFYTPGVLQRYQRTRFIENQQMLLAMEGFHQLFSNRRSISARLRGAGVNLINHHRGLKDWCMMQAMG